MNDNDIRQLWQSPLNRPTPAQLDRHKMQFLTELRRRRLTFRIWIGGVLVALTAATVLAVAHWTSGGESGSAILREWAAPALLLATWAVAVAFVFRYRREVRLHPPATSIPDSLRALREENRQARFRLRVIAGLNAFMLVLVPALVGQLRAAGKAGDEIVVPAFVVLPAVVALTLTAIAWKYRKSLLPRHRQLTALLDSYSAES